MTNYECTDVLLLERFEDGDFAIILKSEDEWVGLKKVLLSLFPGIKWSDGSELDDWKPIIPGYVRYPHRGLVRGNRISPDNIKFDYCYFSEYNSTPTKVEEEDFNLMFE